MISMVQSVRTAFADGSACREPIGEDPSRPPELVT